MSSLGAWQGYQAELALRLGLVALQRKQTAQALDAMTRATELARAGGGTGILAGTALERASASVTESPRRCGRDTPYRYPRLPRRGHLLEIGWARSRTTITPARASHRAFQLARYDARCGGGRAPGFSKELR